MDKHKPEVPLPFRSWLEWALFIAFVLFVVIAAYVVLSAPQISHIFTNVNNNF